MTSLRVKFYVLFILGLLLSFSFAAQSTLTPTWFTPLDNEAIRAWNIADSIEAMVPCILPLSDWAGDVHGSGNNGVGMRDYGAFSGLNVDGEYKFIQGDNAGTATIIGLRTFGDIKDFFHYEISAERWKLPVPQHLYDSGNKWGRFDGVGVVTGANPGAGTGGGSVMALQVDRLNFRTSIKLSPSIEFAIGHGPHHWGPGIRSLYLDRSMAPSSYLRLFIDAGAVHYTHLLLRTLHPFELIDSNEIGWVAAHMVDVGLGGGFSGALFGAVKWQSNDVGVNHRIEPSYLIPVVAFRPSEYALGSSDNALLGAQLIWRGYGRRSPNQKTVYGQILFDELLTSKFVEGTSWWGNKWGVLAGGSLNSRNGKWGCLLEGSIVRPFTYSHATEIAAWTHARKPLAHPLGSNFADLILRLKWVVKDDYIVRLAIERVYRGLDSSTGYSSGSDIFRSYLDRESDYDQIFMQGVGSEFQRISIDISRSTGEKFNIAGIEVFARGSMRVESHTVDDNGEGAITDPWNAFRLQFGIRSTRVLEGRDW